MRGLLPWMFLLAVLPAQADPPCPGSKFKLPNVRLKAGSSTTLKLTAKQLAGIGHDISVTYDEEVAQVTDVRPGPDADGHLVVWNIPESGVLKVALFGAQPLSGNGTLLLIDIVATYDTVPGQRHDATSLVLEVTVDEGAIPACTTNGTLRIG